MKCPLYFLTAAALVAASCATAPTPSTPESYFQTKVKPVLERNCLRCHDGTLPPPALNLSNRAAALKKDARGRPFIVPGDPLHSLLITAIVRGGSHPRAMPLYPMSLTDDQIGALQEWIEDGAHWPAGPKGELRRKASSEVDTGRPGLQPILSF